VRDRDLRAAALALNRADATGCNAALARARSEVRASVAIVAAEDLAAALDLVDAAAGQVAARSLPHLAERLARAYGRTLARLRANERSAARGALRRCRESWSR
jgi:hypothetical protein